MGETMNFSDFKRMLKLAGTDSPDLQVTGNQTVGSVLTAAYKKGSGTINLTRTSVATGAVTDIGTPVASGSTYTVQASDRGYIIGARPVTYLPGIALGMLIPTTAPAAPTITGVSAGNGSVTITLTRSTDTGGDTVTGDRTYVYSVSDNSLLAWADGLTVNGLTNDVAVYCKAATVGASNGAGAQSAASANVTPSAVSPRLMIAASRFGVPTDWALSDGTAINVNDYRQGSSGGQVIRYSDYAIHSETTWAVSRGRFWFTNNAVNNNGVFPGLFSFNILRVEARKLSDNSVIGVAKYQGNTSWTMAPGADIWTDPADFVIPANTAWYPWVVIELSAGSAVPGVVPMQLAGEFSHDSLTVNPTSTGPANTTGFGSQATYYAPTLFVGEGWDGSPVGLMLGDSLLDYTAASATFGTAKGDLGYAHTAFGDATQGRWNVACFARYSSNTVSLIQDNVASSGSKAIMPWISNAMKQIQTQPMFNFIYCNHGHNDVNSGFSTMKANLATATTMAKTLFGSNMVWIHDEIPPDTAAANYSGYTTDADQTPRTNFTLAGNWGLWNNWLRSGQAVTDGVISKAVDSCTDLRSATNPDRWATRSFSTTLLAATSTSTNVVKLAAQAPVRETLVFDVGLSTIDPQRSSRVYTVISSVSDGAGGWDTTLNGGRGTRYNPVAALGSRPAAVHAIGTTVGSLMAADGTHHAQVGIDFRTTRLIAQKAAIKALVPAV
jgi:hypothetical protein